MGSLKDYFSRSFSVFVFSILLFNQSFVFSTNELKCDLDENLVKEIKGYQRIIDKILDYTINGEFKGKTFEDVAVFTDTFGPRMVRSKYTLYYISIIIITITIKNTFIVIITNNNNRPIILYITSHNITAFYFN